MEDLVENLRNRARMETAAGPYNPEDHIAWLAAQEIEGLRERLNDQIKKYQYLLMKYEPEKAAAAASATFKEPTND